ncbi:YagK/YfjJ domain-containing protein, partial [Acinetobacter sp. MD2(2019)]|uniref:YagK/YfjJ domain-containing protein n=1 Tax=Acinetobacter sp. MD2(2019) TaxID=2605273 RepID=UPI002D1F7691
SHAADDQHASSFVLDYLLDFNAELNQYEIRSNPEAQRIFLEIEFVTYVLKNNVIKAYRQITSEFRHGQYEPIDPYFVKCLKQILKQGFDPLEKYDCEHHAILMQAYDAILKDYFHTDLYLHYANDKVQTINSDGTCTTIGYAELINSFVERLYLLTQEKAFKYQQKKRMDRSRHQFKVAKQCVDWILAKHSRIVVIRIDFRYGKNQNPELAQVKADLITCLRYLKRTITLHFLGYLWKLEFAEKTGYHYHCFFFLDGRKHCQDIKLAQQIGEVWKRVVGDEGAYYNCNLDAHKGKYHNIGIGMLSRSDQQKYQYLMDAIRYITKKDQFIVHKRIQQDEQNEQNLRQNKAYFIRVFGTNIAADVALKMNKSIRHPTQQEAGYE